MQAAKKSAAEALAKKVVASIKLKLKWQEIEVKNASDGDYTISLWYKKMPSGYQEISNDTKLIVRAFLKELVAQGKKPSEDMTTIFVHAYKKEPGETQEMVRSFGKAMYDYTVDAVVFEPRKK